MKILISGASGLVGGALTKSLRADGHTIARFVRPGRTASPGDVRWDPASALADVPAMEGAGAVVHLSGANIAGTRWTPARKALLRSSRIDSTRLLVDALAKLQCKPQVLLCASASGFYGDRGEKILTESSEAGADFLALLARDWEAEAMRAAQNGIRTVMLRFGVILSGEGGALPKMLPPFRFGLGARLGSGRQWMPWITLEDTIGVIRTAISDGRIAGPLNVVAPNPVRNADFTRILARVLQRPAILAAPAFALRIALGEMADALLASDRVRPERLLQLGYAFRYAELERALRVILDREK